MLKKQSTLLKNISADFASATAVFFVAISLCIGIAHASNAPLISGLIGGIIGGIVIGSISKSPLSVSGPAAGLTTVVIHGISELGSFEAFLCSIIIAGFLQLLLGALRIGFISEYFPNSVIKGMLAAIGLILIFKQLPHLLGYDIEVMGSEHFQLDVVDIKEAFLNIGFHHDNTFTILFDSLKHIQSGVLIIGVSSLVFLLAWDYGKLNKKFPLFPSIVVAVGLGIGLNYLFEHYASFLMLPTTSLVNLPALNNFQDLLKQSARPDFIALTSQINQILIIAVTIALVASLETLLSIKAIDKIDPKKRETPANRELIAQGVGNMLSGFFGGIPLTSVIVRSSVNVTAGAKSKLSTILHGIFLLVAIIALTDFVNSIPLACLAAILIHTGLKLNDYKIYKSQFEAGFDQIIPFLATIAGVLLIDLLTGVAIGVLIAGFFIIKNTYEVPVVSFINKEGYKKIILGEHLNFIQKHKIKKILDTVTNNSILEIDHSRTIFIDHDIQELLIEFSEKAIDKRIIVRMEGKPNWMKASKMRKFDKIKNQHNDFMLDSVIEREVND